MKNSLWQETASRPSFPTLSGGLSTDVLIVGGGMAGLLCAHRLSEAGVDCVLVESGRICNGTTGNTTAKITVQHGAIFDKMLRRFGVDQSRRYFAAQCAALNAYRALSREIECDFEECDSFVYSLDDTEKLERELVALLRLGARAELMGECELPFAIAGALRLGGQAQFHPLKFAFGIAQNLRIFEQTKVLEFTEDGAVTSSGRIRAKRVVVTTHFPILNKYGAYFLKMYQHRSYVLALQNAPRVEGMYMDERKTGISLRTWGEYLLLGGGGHRTGKSGGCWRELEEFAEKYYNGARVAARWAAQDTITLDDLPYIGRYSPRTPNLFVATGFNKWGMTTSMLAADLLCVLLRGKEHPCEEMLSPARSVWRPRLFSNAAHSVAGLLTPTVPRCPHLGCALQYNAAEHSWDCPCHGSRFGEDGTLLDGPATDDKRL